MARAIKREEKGKGEGAKWGPGDGMADTATSAARGEAGGRGKGGAERRPPEFLLKGVRIRRAEPNRFKSGIAHAGADAKELVGEGFGPAAAWGSRKRSASRESRHSFCASAGERNSSPRSDEGGGGDFGAGRGAF